MKGKQGLHTPVLLYDCYMHPKRYEEPVCYMHQKEYIKENPEK